MIFYVLAGTALILGLAVLVALVWRKLPQLRSIDVQDLPEEQQREMKNKLLTTRLKRAVADVRARTAPVAKSARGMAKSAYDRVHQLEKEYRKKAATNDKAEDVSETPAEDAPLSVEDQLAAADGLREVRDYAGAEAAYIAILQEDQNTLVAYSGLSEVYLATQEYAKAAETCEFAIKLVRRKRTGSAATRKHQEASCRADLGEVYRASGKLDLAKNEFEQAVKLQPTNPRYLDLLLKISILLKNKTLAERTLRQLKKVDASNRKLDDLAAQVQSIEE